MPLLSGALAERTNPSLLYNAVKLNVGFSCHILEF